MYGWNLYIDESGAFERAEQDVVISGILVYQEGQWLFPQTLRQRLQDAAPHVPWPFHTRYLLSPLMHCLWTAQLATGDAQQKAEADLAQFGATDCVGLLQRIRDGLANGEEPRLEAFKRLENVFSASRCLQDWSQRRDEATHALRLLFEDLTAPLVPNAPFYTLLASEAVRGDCFGHRQDRYLTLLGALLERSVDLLLERGDGPHQIFVCPLQRNTFDSLINKHRPLSSRDIDHCIRTSATPRPYENRHTTVSLVAGQPQPFDADTCFFHVVADYLATRGRTHFFERPDHAHLIDAIRTESGLPEPYPLEPTPSGVPQRTINASRKRGSPEPLPVNDLKDAAPWARDSAHIWSHRVALH